MLKGLRLNTKFNLAIGSIIFMFCVAFSFLLYYHLKERAIEEAHNKIRIITEQVNAVGAYIKEELRPRMFEILSNPAYKEDFILEAMSTTYVRCRVMALFNKELPEYIFKRVAVNPRNPNNKADAFHEKMIGYFSENRDIASWNGIVTLEGKEFLVRARPVIGEKGCLKCHGSPSHAPKELIRRYGREGGFGWKEEGVAGVESVAIPLHAVFGQIKGIALSSLIFGLGTLIFLFIALKDTFSTFVSKPLKRLTRIFEGIAKGTESLTLELPITTKDEIGELTASFNLMARHLFNAQEELKNNAETLRSTFEGISDPLALINHECTVEMRNRAYGEWTEKGVSAVFVEVCKNRDRGLKTACDFCLLEKVKELKKDVFEYFDDNGHFYYSHLYPIFDEKGNVVKVVHYVKDVTDRREIEERMRKAEKLTVMGQLSAGIAHEINNPLGGIRLCFNNLMSLEMDEKTRQKHVEVINSGFERIQSVIMQLLDFSKQSSLSLSSVSINQLTENVLRLVDHILSKKGIKVVKDLTPDIKPVLVDPNKIEEVFLNIILNAMQAMDGKPGILTINVTQRNGYREASFSDTGPGIPGEILPFIFDPFFTTKQPGCGTGLGLSVSKSIVEQHNGEILVETSKHGAKFTVRLPVGK
jgi:nitrogen-specific signal transduction histidine kinase/HAMP domain-containing protein